MSLKTQLKSDRQSGVSMPEILIVLTILGVLVALAVPSFTKADVQLQRQNVAQQLKTTFDRARSDSIKRSATTSSDMAKVVVDTNSFSTTLDLNSNGTLQPNTETRVTNISNGSGTTIVGSNMAFPVTVTFDNRGQAKATDKNGATVTPSFVICGQNCTYATANQANSNTLSISPTGAVALIEKGQAFFDRPLPDIKKITSNTSKINPDAQVK